MASEDAMQHALQQLIVEDAVGQLRRREGLMAALGSENGVLKLDWVEAVARLLADPDALEDVEAEARALRARGICHIIWAGMGGSVLTVRVLCDLASVAGVMLTEMPSQFIRWIAPILPRSTRSSARLLRRRGLRCRLRLGNQTPHSSRHSYAM